MRRPDRSVATMDHSIPTLFEGDEPLYARRRNTRESSRGVASELRRVRRHGCFRWATARQGIVHVIGPELGLTQPGMTIVCGDSHTSTHGAFGAWAFGIGSTEVGHVMATQSLLQRKPGTLEVRIDGRAPSLASRPRI